MRVTLCLIVATLILGCDSAKPEANKAVQGPVVTEPHTHERGKMMLADAGPYHAALTAHLAKDGNELDVFIETDNDEPQPVALPLVQIIAKAKRSGDTQEYKLIFEPAPADERPKSETIGTCSHFVAKAPWMTRADMLTVVAELEVKGKLRKVIWGEFSPLKFAHHDEPGAK